MLFGPSGSARFRHGFIKHPSDVLQALEDELTVVRLAVDEHRARMRHLQDRHVTLHHSA